MSQESNMECARQWYEEMWTRPDLDLADELVDQDYDPEWIHIDAVGPAQVKHEIRYFRSVFPDLIYEIIDAVAKQDQVWVRYRASGTQIGPAWGFEPTGKPVTFEGATIFTFSSAGKIVDRWGAFCFYDVLTDLGLAPTLWELNKTLNP